MASVLRGCAVPRPVCGPRPGGRSRGEHCGEEEPGVTLAGGHQGVAGIQFRTPASRRRAVRGHSLPDSPGRSLIGQTFVATTVVFEALSLASQPGRGPACQPQPPGSAEQGRGPLGTPCAVTACAEGISL